MGFPPRVGSVRVARLLVGCGLLGRLVEVLLARCSSVVSRRDLGVAAWPDGVPGTRAVDARLRRLRDRVEPLGLQIHNVRRRGLLLEVCPLSE